MQINRIGIGLIAGFIVAGAALIAVPLALGVPGQVTGILALVGAIWIVVALGLWLFARSQKRKAAHQDWVFAHGIKGTATVVKASSHAKVNELPLMSLVLDLEVPGVADRQVKRRVLMSVFAANRVQPGLVLPVHVNPEDPDDLVLVW
jgi:type IV secretory pathway TrbD component